MESSLLKKSREYEATHGERIGAEERPDFHFSPRVGWMNDPNACCPNGSHMDCTGKTGDTALYTRKNHWGHSSRQLLG